MKISLEILNDYVKRGLISKQNHSQFPLSIYTYTRVCQYDRIWDDITMQCRGLILDNEGNVVAKPFPKFFNYDEHDKSEIPNEPFEVYEKLDGSLGIIYHYNNEWHIATKGDFHSEQAIKGKKLLDKSNTKYGLIPGWSYLVEIIYSDNRIIVDYGDEEKLVVLGCYNIENGQEGTIDNMASEGWEIVKRYDGISDYTQLKETIGNDREGYVVRFKNGFRIKIKGDEYVRLHRIFTNCSTTVIWEHLKEGSDMNELLENVPDEFDRWVRIIANGLRYSFYQIDERAGKLHDYFRYGKYNDVDPESSKKEFAEFVMKQEPFLRPIMFAMWDKKPYDDIIWRMIKPKWSPPFREDIDK